MLHTHCHRHTEKPTHDAIDILVNLFIARLCTVHRPVCPFPHPQAEQIRFADDEIQILVINLTDALRSARLCSLRCEVFEQGTGYRGKKIDVCWRVQAVLEILGDPFKVRCCRLDEVEDRYVGNRVALPIDVSDMD